MNKKAVARIVLAGIGAFALIGLLSNRQRYDDISAQLQTSAVSVTELTGQYSSQIVWLDEESFVLHFCPGCLFETDPELKDGFYYWDFQTLKRIEGPQLEYCSKYALGNFQPLPENLLGLIIRCHISNNRPGVNGELSFLLSWNPADHDYSILIEFEKNQNASFYSMNIKQDALAVTHIGHTPGGYQVVEYNLVTDQQSPVPEFYRARSPQYTPRSSLLFFGNLESFGDIRTNDDLRNWALAPWSLYLLEERDQPPIELIENVRVPVVLRHRPNTSMYSFVGTIGNVNGIWLFDIETGRLQRIWSQGTGYSWSPDGTQFVVLSNSIEGKRYPIIVSMGED